MKHCRNEKCGAENGRNIALFRPYYGQYWTLGGWHYLRQSVNRGKGDYLENDIVLTPPFAFKPGAEIFSKSLDNKISKEYCA